MSESEQLEERKKNIHSALQQYFNHIDAATNPNTSHPYNLIINHEATDTIAPLFAEDACYIRNQSYLSGPRAITGRSAIRDFIASDRALIGAHDIEKITIVEGLADGIKAIAPATICKKSTMTAKVTGSFSGANFAQDHQSRLLVNASTTELKFDDYWVFDATGKVVFRYSDIAPAIAKKQEISRN